VPDGPALFSLRPEHLHLSSGTPAAVRLKGKVLTQAFHGATDLIRVECADGLVLSLRTASGGIKEDNVELEFSPTDAIPVRESPERN
jgi:hypothetical protein